MNLIAGFRRFGMSRAGLGSENRGISHTKVHLFSKKLPKIEKVARGSLNTSHKLALQEKCNRLSINPRENNQNQKNIIWNDPYININWPIKKPILSKNDANALKLNEIKELPK